jgi:hypothetical protein
MAVWEIEGQRFEFDRDPSDADIDEIAEQIRQEQEPGAARKVAGFATRVAAPFLGGVAGAALAAPIPIPGARVAGALIGAGLAGGAAEFPAAAIEKEEVTPGRVVASTLLGAVPGAPVARAARPLARIGIRAAQGAFEGAAQETIEEAIDVGGFDPARTAAGAVGGALIGGAFGGVEARLGRGASQKIIDAQEVPPEAPTRVSTEAEPDIERELVGLRAEEPTPAAVEGAPAPARGPFRRLPGEPEGLPPVQPKRARVLTPDDVVEFTHLDDEGQDELARIIADNQDTLNKAAGGRVSLRRSAKLAERIQVDPDDIPQGEVAGTASEIFASKNFVEAMMGRIARLSEQIASGEIAEQTGEAAMMKANADLVRGIELMQNLTSTAGRALRAAREKTRGELPLLFKPGFTKQALKAGASAEDIIGALTRAGDNPTQLFRELMILRKKNETTAQKISSLFISNLLFHPKTFIRNAAGNMVRLATDVAVTPVAAALDVPLSAITGSERQILIGESAAKVAAIVKALPEATRAFMQVWRQGFTDAQALRALRTGDFTTRIETVPIAPGFGGRGERILGASTRILEGTDAFFRLLAEGSAVNAAAFKRAQTLGAKVGAGQRARTVFQKELFAKWIDPLTRAENPALDKEIEDTALRLLFREQNKAADLINNAIEKIPNTPGKLMARWLIPFVRTPTNIVKQGLNFTPLGFLTTRGEVSGRLRRTKQAEAAVGTMIMGTLVNMVVDGRLTGPAPRDKRDQFLAQVPENSVYLGDTLGWQRYTDLGPVAIPLGVAATWTNRMLEAGRVPEELTTEEALVPYQEATKAAIDAGFDTMVDFPFMQGIESILDLTTGHGDTGDRAVRFARGRVSALMGGPGRLAKEAFDPLRRQPVGLEAPKAEIPGVSRQVRPKLSPFGREIERPGLLSPFAVTQPEAGEARIARELVRLRVPVAADRPFKKITDKKKSVKITPTEDVAYRKARGTLIREKLEALFSRPGYDRMSPKRQKTLVEKARRDARALVKGRALSKKRRGLTFSLNDLLRRNR